PLVLERSALADQQPGSQGTDRHGLQRPLLDFDLEGLDDVADLDVVVAGNLQAALEAFADLLDVFLEALEAVETDDLVRRGINHDALADHADAGVAFDGSAGDVATGDDADLADFE